MNPIDKDSAITLSEGNLKVVQTASTWDSARGTFSPTSGKWYFELVIPAIWNYGHVGLLQNVYKIGDANAYENAGSWTYQFDGRTHTNNVESNASLPTLSSGDIVQTAYDVDAGKLWWGVNNTWLLSGNPSTAASPVYSGITGDISPHLLVYGSPATGVILNFGQDSSFAGTDTAQGNQDSNDIGDFYYEPPTDFLALCTSNLPEPAVIPSEHFNAVSYTGNASTNAITGVGFQPDFLWLKKGNGGHHFLFDSVRGAGKQLKTSHTGGDTTHSNYLASFDTDGFTIGSDTDTNADTIEHISWSWKAGTTTSGTTSGSGTGKAYSASYNTDAGFSIVTYTGNGTAGHTIPHHLGSKPQYIVVKKRSDTDAWVIYNEPRGATKYMYWNSTGAEGTSHQLWNDTEPTSSVFTTYSNTETNGNDATYIAYCWRSVDGYSKVGSYTGNGNADGTFVYTGFRPAYILLRRTNSSGGWNILDNKREPYNPSDERAEAQAASAFDNHAAYATDFLSNGFKMRGTSTEWNGSGDTFLYLAFAKEPFKYSNAR
jgi:hypothetical protein